MEDEWLNTTYSTGPSACVVELTESCSGTTGLGQPMDLFSSAYDLTADEDGSLYDPDSDECSLDSSDNEGTVLWLTLEC